MGVWSVKRLRRYVRAADEGEDTRLDDMMDSLKADFDYFMDGLDKLARTSAADRSEALIIAEALSDRLQTSISEIAEKIS